MKQGFLGAGAAALGLILAPGLGDIAPPSLPSVSAPEVSISKPAKPAPAPTKSSFLPQEYNLGDDAPGKCDEV